MQPPFPSATPTWRNDTYEAISPLRFKDDTKGKTVIITGAGSGIGRETALAFAEAGAARLVLLGRRQNTLSETANAVQSKAEVSTFVVDITDESTLKQIANEVGIWDVLILNAGYLSAPAAIKDASVDDWWQSYETNVKGTLVTVQAFLATANPTHAAILGNTAGTFSLPAAMLTGISAYISSKLAQVKLLEFVAAEHPNIFVASVHPGMIVTEIFSKSGATPDMLPMDTLQLPAHFMVWLVSPEGAFLKGKTVWANWDATELKAQAETISAGPQLTSGSIGWPFPHHG